MRRALKILAAFVVLLVAGVVAAIFLIPREQIVALAVDQVREATGRELALTGDVSPSFWPVLGVRTGAVRLSNADWAETPDMVSASAAEIGVELLPLLSGEVRITTLRLVDPVVALEIGGDGRPNWDFSQGASTGETGSSGSGDRDIPVISLPEAVITNGKLSFNDARSGQRIEFAELNLTARLAGMDAPLKLDGSGLWNGQLAEISAHIDTPAAAMEGRKTIIRLTLTSDPATIRFDGDIVAPQVASGDGALPLINGAVTAKLPDVAAAMAWATGTDAPNGLDALGAVELAGDIAAADAALALSAKGSVGYNGRSVGFDLKAAGSEGWHDRQALDLTAGAQVDGMFKLSFNGPVTGGDAPSATGPLKIAVSDLRGLAEWAGGTPLAAPEGTMNSASLDTFLALDGGDRIDLSDLSITLDDTNMTGSAGIDLGGARPLITARLETGPLDLSAFAGGTGGTDSGQGEATQGWSTEPLDLSGLRAVDADVAIRAEAVDLGEIEIGRSDIDARLRNGKLDMRIDRVDAYGGGMSGTITLLADDEAQLSTDLTVSAVQLRPLLNALAGFDSLEGLGQFRIKLNGRGASMDALMKSLDGQGALDLTDGAILGVNLASVVRNLTGQESGLQKTDFSAVTGTFDITNGVLNNADFSLLGPLLRVIGAGTVDIGRQVQNFRLEPTAVASLTGQGGGLKDGGLGVFPILITGTWANPSIRPDLTGAIEGLLTNPQGAIEAVTGLIEGGDPAEALLGAISGSDGSGDGAGDALGKALGGLLGGGSSGGDTTTEQGSGGTTGLGGLLGALGGNSDGGTERDETAAQPNLSADGVATEGSAAPLRAPLPAPPPPDRAARAALPGDLPPESPQDVSQPTVAPTAEGQDGDADSKKKKKKGGLSIGRILKEATQ